MPSDLRPATIGFVAGGLTGGLLVGVAAWWFSPAPPTSPAVQVLAATQAVLDDYSRIVRMREVLGHASSARANVAESAMNHARMPASNAEAALPAADYWRLLGLEDVSVAADGSLMVEFAAPFAGRVRFRPIFLPGNSRIRFECTSPDVADIDRIDPSCRFRPDRSDDDSRR